jgi:uncharacterized protein (DUF2147 family)
MPKYDLKNKTMRLLQMQKYLAQIPQSLGSKWIAISFLVLALNALNSLAEKTPSAPFAASDSGSQKISETSPIGQWKSIDDITGKPRSIIKIWQEDGKLKGKIESLFPQPGLEPDPLCIYCPDSLKGHKIRGLTILWGLYQAGEWWEGGQILDPKNGKVYRCKLQTFEGGKKLRVRGFIGIAVLGRSQVWLRES